MTTVNETFLISTETLNGLKSGLLERHGGIIRYATGSQKGQIKEHLKPILNNKETKNIIKKAINLAKSNYIGLIIGASVTIVISGSVLGVYIVKNYEPKIIKEFKRAFQNYTKELSDGTLTPETVNCLIEKLDEIKEHRKCSKLCAKLSMEDLYVFLSGINQNNEEKTKDNSVETTDTKEHDIDNTQKTIIDFHEYLENQKQSLADIDNNKAI